MLRMVTAKDGVCLRALLFSAASWSHLSPVQEALLLWQPHTCNERASATHTHSCAHSDPLNYWSALRASHVSVSRRRAALPPLLIRFCAQVCLYRCLRRARLLTSDLNLSNQLPFGWFKLWTCSVNWSRVAAVLTEAESLSWVAFSRGAELKSI